MYTLVNARIFNGHSFLENSALIIEKGKIKDIVLNSLAPSDVEKIDLKGSLIAPAMIDLQINGCNGVLFNENISVETLEIIYKTCLHFGCASFAPALITATDEDIEKALECAIAFDKKYPLALAALHIEGPFINKKKKGAHSISLIRKLDEKITNLLCAKVKEIPIILTLAPEENDISLIKKLISAGADISIGHTNASYKEAEASFAAGIKRATHLFNTMSPFESKNPGTAGAVLNNPVWAGIIIDGFHSDFASVQIAAKIKQDRLYIVTDAVSAMGSDLTEFVFGGQKVYFKDGKCINEEGALAGSAIDMATSVRNAIFKCKIPAEQALKMATLFPAKSLGKDSLIGQIQKGMTANLAVFDKDFNVKMTFANGVKVFDGINA